MLTRTKGLIGLGVVLAVVAVGLRFVGGPVLVRYPLNINQTLHYHGTATVYVNPATGLPLAQPLRVPLTIDRQVKVVSGTFSHAVISEKTTATFAGNSSTQTYQYYMNRRNMRLVDGPQSYAFGDPAQSMATGGSYRINFPTGTTAGKTYEAWAPETGTTIQVKAAGGAQREPVSGDRLLTFSTNLDHPVAPYYLAYLKSTGMPASIPAATVAAELQASGVSVQQVLQAVAPHLSASQMATLQAAFTKSIPLSYSYFQHGYVSVQPSTGAVIKGGSSSEGVAATPDLSSLAPAEAVLAPYASLPQVQALAKAAAAMGRPQVVLQMSYSEDAASIRAADRIADHQAALMSLIEWQLPALVGALALAVLILAAAWRPRPRTTPAEATVEAKTQTRKAA
ncbi:MAG TPA: porin PorA family protein [Acidimicrobiales bacterium]|nr:porin PorA family protein [Acidimicrobiales bacterium]